jgi:Abnormal spindle-like microcephaly-assoc'd, ASPM-SPD-2-Hydin
MRRVAFALLVAGLFVSSPCAWAQISLVYVETCGPGPFPATVCTIPATGSGNLIVVAWASNNGGGATTIASITDNAANAYAEAPTAKAVDSAANTMIDLWYAKNSTSAATTLTITPNPVGTTGTAVIWEFAGVNIATPLDQVAVLNSQPATSTPAGAPVTTAAAVEVVISVANVQGTLTGIVSGNSFTNDSTANGDGWAHLFTSFTGTYTAEWNNSGLGTYASSTASFTAAGADSACDLNQDGTVNILDVELATDMALAPPPCTAPFGQCNFAFAQAVLTSAMGGACALPVLGVAPSSISFGNVTVGNSSTQTATLTGTGTAGSTISQATVSGAEFSISGLSFPLTLPVGQSASLNVTFTPTTAGSASGNIAFISNALDTPVNVTLSGTGVTAVAHSVSLSWTPSTSTDVASYNIYRTTSSSPTAPPTPYPSLSSVLATTCSPTVCTYADTSVQAGLGYWYYAAAVDTSGNVSVPSNIVSAVVPGS